MSPTATSVTALATCIVLSTAANVLFKLGLDRMQLDLRWDSMLIEVGRLARNPYIAGGVILYASGFLSWMWVLARFRYSEANLYFSLQYVVMLIVAILIFKDPVTWWKSVGAVLIVAGVALVSKP